MNHHHQRHGPSPLDVGEMAKFDDTLDECDDEERKRRRIIYMKDAVEKINAGKDILKAFGCLIIPFAIIPIFWPFLIFAHIMQNKQKSLLAKQLENALEYWQLNPTEVGIAGGTDERCH